MVAMVQNIAYGIPSEEMKEYGVHTLIWKNSYSKTYRVTASDNSFYFLRVNILNKIPQRMLDEQGDVVSFKLAHDLCHENIAQVFHGRYFNETLGQYQYIKTESFDGELLSDRLKREGRLSLDESLHIIRETLKGLSYLHTRKKPVLFNYLTPQHIILNNDGTVKLVNLGHLSILDIPFVELPFANEELDEYYLAPETYHDIYVPQADLYSASAVFYQMLLGHIPYPTVSLADRNKHSMEDSSCTIEPDFTGTGLPEAYRKILSRGLRWHIFSRYQHAENIISDIDEASKTIVPSPLQKEAILIAIDKQQTVKESFLVRDMSKFFGNISRLSNKNSTTIISIGTN